MKNPFARKQASTTGPPAPAAAPEVLGKGTGLNGSDIVELGVSDAACLATNRIMVDGDAPSLAIVASQDVVAVAAMKQLRSLYGSHGCDPAFGLPDDVVVTHDLGPPPKGQRNA
jgi:hypothetical protein